MHTFPPIPTIPTILTTLTIPPIPPIPTIAPIPSNSHNQSIVETLIDPLRLIQIHTRRQRLHNTAVQILNDLLVLRDVVQAVQDCVEFAELVDVVADGRQQRLELFQQVVVVYSYAIVGILVYFFRAMRVLR
jgi:hypothetical protein